MSSPLARQVLEKDYGPQCFTKPKSEGGCVGTFLTNRDMRPYMNLLRALGTVYLARREWDLATCVRIRLFCLPYFTL